MSWGRLTADLQIRGEQETHNIQYELGATESLLEWFTGSTPTAVGYGVLAMSPLAAPKFLGAFNQDITQFLYQTEETEDPRIFLGRWDDNDAQLTWLPGSATPESDRWRVAGPDDLGDVVFSKSSGHMTRSIYASPVTHEGFSA